MKNLIIPSLTTSLACLLTLLFFGSCSQDDDSTSTSSSAPVITSVAQSGYDESNKLIELSSVSRGFPKNYYVIRGTGLSSVKKIYFNDYDTYFRPAFVTDTEIFVLLDEKTPYANGSNKLKVVTDNGTVEYDFVVMPPTPTFNGYVPINAADGEVITLYGNYFLNPIVTVGTVTVPVISSTLTEIKVKLPANSLHKYVSVTTISGTKTAPEAIGSALYDDALIGSQWGGPWAGTGVNFDYDKDSYQGLKSWEWNHGAYAGGNWGFNIDMSPYKALRIAIKGSRVGIINFQLNGGATYVLPTTTSWVYMEIPLSQLGNPSSVWMLTFQNFSQDENFQGVANTVLYDDIGFVLK